MIYCENIVNEIYIFFYSSDFRTTFFFPPIFDNAIATIVTIFFFLISAMTLPQLVCHKFFFFFTLGTPRTLHTWAAGIGQRNFGIHITKIQHFLFPPFSSSLLYFLLNFGNGNTKIHSLSSQF